jgi:hypothetical protein
MVPVPPEGPADGHLVCEYMLYDNDEAGGWGGWKQIDYLQEGHGFSISIREMQPHHSVRVRLVDTQNNIWESYDHRYGISLIQLRKVQDA